MDRVITWIFLGFGMLAALDRIFGNRLGLGKEFEKGMMMLGTLTLSMTGMLTIAPLIAEGLSILSENIPLFFDFSILPASLLANDMGGAHLAAQLASDAQVGVFNGLVVSSMMGCTVSFTLPFVLQATDDSIRKDVFFGLLCGIVTIPIGCLIAGLLAGFSILDLLCNLLPLLLLAALISLCLLKFERITIRVFSCIGDRYGGTGGCCGGISDRGCPSSCHVSAGRNHGDHRQHCLCYGRGVPLSLLAPKDSSPSFDGVCFSIWDQRRLGVRIPFHLGYVRNDL